MSRSHASAGSGCLLLVAAAAVIGVAVWVLSLVVALFMTPIPYVTAAVLGAVYLVRCIRRAGIEKLYWDVVAGRHGWLPKSAERETELWRRGGQEPDVLALQAVCLAADGWLPQAITCIDAAARLSQRLGRVSGGVALWVPGQVEPIEIGAGASGAANLALIQGCLEVLRGDGQAALTFLVPRLHEPHYGAAAYALAEAYRLAGSAPRAAAVLHEALRRVAQPGIERALRYRRAVLLESLGAGIDAMHELRTVLASGPYADASHRLSVLEHQQSEVRAREVAARDASAYHEALSNVRLARGPTSRANALYAALAKIAQPHVREQLLLEASRLEVQAVLEKVAGLKTKSARVRNLQEAIARLKVDEVPDVLQADELAYLERSLAQELAS
jgi:hypothetical protein